MRWTGILRIDHRRRYLVKPALGEHCERHTCRGHPRYFHHPTRPRHPRPEISNEPGRAVIAAARSTSDPSLQVISLNQGRPRPVSTTCASIHIHPPGSSAVIRGITRAWHIALTRVLLVGARGEQIAAEARWRRQLYEVSSIDSVTRRVLHDKSRASARVLSIRGERELAIYPVDAMPVVTDPHASVIHV